jgi:hypothetical protein
VFFEHFEISRRPKRFERSKAIERLERLEQTDPRGERSGAIERLERALFYGGSHLSHATCQLLYTIPGIAPTQQNSKSKDLTLKTHL